MKIRRLTAVLAALVTVGSLHVLPAFAGGDEEAADDSRSVDGGRIRGGGAINTPFLLTLLGKSSFDEPSLGGKLKLVVDACSAVRVGSGVALTARHCVCKSSGAVRDDLYIGFTRCLENSTNISSFRPVASSGIVVDCGNFDLDIAQINFIEFAGLSGANTVFQVRKYPAFTGTSKLRIFGIGDSGSGTLTSCTDGGGFAELRGAGVQPVTCAAGTKVGEFCIKPNSNSNDPEAGFACGGDSGGAVIEEQAEIGKALVGILARQYHPCAGAADDPRRVMVATHAELSAFGRQ